MSKTAELRTSGDLKSHFDGFTNEEHETHLTIDYAAGVVIIYTTRRNVFDQFLKRAGKLPGVKIDRPGRTIRVPLKFARRPWMLLRPAK